jgi:murein DD-endopeptidase MepM/ murein hydrolase activator NlpD
VGARRGIRIRSAVIVAALAMTVSACGLGEGEERQSGDRTTAETGLPAEPSAFARRSLTGEQIHLYRSTGGDLGLDWTVIAATDQIEGSATPAEERERISAVGYTLRSYGAPDDYRLALETYDGSRAFARSVLKLAERYRALAAARVPKSALPMELPANGPIIATYGQRLGILHDGIDIDVPTGAPVRAAAAGLVLSTGSHRVFGETTCVLHHLRRASKENRQVTSCYGNQSGYEAEAGERVAVGELIGRAGCTGTCIRPHVHFQVRLGVGQSAPVTDPARFLRSDIVPGRPGTPLEGPAP